YDTSFGDGGSNSNVNFDNAGSYQSATAITILPDDSIVITGSTYLPSHTGIAKFTPNGALDTSFGGTGTGYETLHLNNTEFGGDYPSGMAALPDGNLVIVGQADSTAWVITETDPHGIPNTSFGAPKYSTGTVRLSFNGNSGA